jgi:hypothetical protein
MKQPTDVKTKIANGYYESKRPYVRADDQRLFQEFKRDVLLEHGISTHPQADKIFDFANRLEGRLAQAWDGTSHQESLQSIFDILEEIAPFLHPHEGK